MTKLVTVPITLLLLLFTINVSAQTFLKGELALNAGLGLDVSRYDFGGSYSYSPPLSLTAEYSISDHFALGAYVGYLSRNYSFTNEKSKLVDLSYGLRGTFHYTYWVNELLNVGLQEEKLDLYASFLFGIQNLKWDKNTLYHSKKTYTYGPVIGLRYMFVPNFGAFIEGGRGIHGAISLGLTARF